MRSVTFGRPEPGQRPHLVSCLSPLPSKARHSCPLFLETPCHHCCAARSVRTPAEHTAVTLPIMRLRPVLLIPSTSQQSAEKLPARPPPIGRWADGSFLECRPTSFITDRAPLSCPAPIFGPPNQPRNCETESSGRSGEHVMTEASVDGCRNLLNAPVGHVDPSQASPQWLNRRNFIAAAAPWVLATAVCGEAPSNGAITLRRRSIAMSLTPGRHGSSHGWLLGRTSRGTTPDNCAVPYPVWKLHEGRWTVRCPRHCSSTESGKSSRGAITLTHKAGKRE
ncbi:hypothetical protein B0J12DRAFT_13686 [Macrophomina phaseolina]|uniref:Uncharacterized protein n=1 Tax=Macrophomina phaseolina TaxID=35725 RepID=A0ABQ8GXC8_9PEZI|nr:hypothetical protein B0J12DRAFT_13686 [Macrophomina phaseolina]